MEKNVRFYMRNICLTIVAAILLPLLSTVSFFSGNTKPKTVHATEVLTTPMVGIDVSSWNQEIDWAKVKQAGTEFAIIRITSHIKNTPNYKIDDYFERNVREASAQGIKLGAYFFSYAQTLSAITDEANMIVNILNDYPGVFSFPIVFDAEDGDKVDDPDVEGYDVYDIGGFAGDASKTFCEILAANGYYPMVYSYSWYYENVIGPNKIKDYDFWLASYPRIKGTTTQKYAGTSPADAQNIVHSDRETVTNDANVKMWQYTGAGKIDGIYAGDGGSIVDLNVCYVDYPKIIIEGGYNGYDKLHEHEYKLVCKDDTYHHEACDCGEVKEGSEKKHTIVNCVCSCGYEKHFFEYVDKGDYHVERCIYCYTEKNTSSHSYTFVATSTEHYKQCVCGHIDESSRQEHTYINGVCAVCSHRKNESAGCVSSREAGLETTCCFAVLGTLVFIKKRK